MSATAPIRFQQRQDTTANWNAANPILLQGEMGVEFTPSGAIAFKIGNGVMNASGNVTGTRWNDLPYASGPPGPPPAHEWNNGNLRFKKPDGTWGEYHSCKGPQGEQGIQGIQGVPGLSPQHQWNGYQLRFQKPDGTWGDYVNIRGQVGPQGETGPRGPQGVAGPPYTLPPATKTVLGGIKVGSNLEITLDGCLSAKEPIYMPIGTLIAFAGKLGGSDGRRPISNGVADEHWALCDGILTEGVGTPDLRDRMILGAGPKYPYLSHGGDISHTHGMFYTNQDPSFQSTGQRVDAWDTTWTGFRMIFPSDDWKHTHKINAGWGYAQHGTGHKSGQALAWADPQYVNTGDWNNLGSTACITSAYPQYQPTWPQNHQHYMHKQQTEASGSMPPYQSFYYLMRIK